MKPSHPTRSRSRIGGLLILLIVAGCAGSVPVEGELPDGPPPPRVKHPPAPKEGSSTVAGCNGIPESGQCADGIASYCDLAAGELRRKDCKALGKSCIVDSARGAVCETVEPGGTGTVCDTGVTHEGSCGGPDNNTAIWCDETSKQTVAWECGVDGGDSGKSCQEDACTVGAYCCDKVPTQPVPMNECATLGFYGECGGANGNTARWCASTSDTQVLEKVCGTNERCELDTCAEGAFCCPKEPAPVNECDQVGTRGVCTADGKIRWCSSNGTFHEYSCYKGTCQVDACGDGAQCCE